MIVLNHDKLINITAVQAAWVLLFNCPNRGLYKCYDQLYINKLSVKTLILCVEVWNHSVSCLPPVYGY